MGLAAPGFVPAVDQALQIIPHGQQTAVLGGEAGEDVGHPGPEGRDRQIQPGQDLFLDQCDQFRGDFKAGAGFKGGHQRCLRRRCCSASFPYL